MPVPSRDDLPAKFVAVLEKHDDERRRVYGREPVLPAPATPDELVEMAQKLTVLLDRHLAEGSSAADEINLALRFAIDAVLRREVVEPVRPLPLVQLIGTDRKRVPELTATYSAFASLLRGIDRSTPDEMARFREDMVWRRKHFAAELGVELELTDEEWFEL